MLYIIYAPPGMGKSTVIERLSVIHHKVAFDLEKADVTRLDREMFLHTLAEMEPSMHVYVGAADVPPDFKSDSRNVRKILLTMPQANYERRREFRDKLQPGKRTQRKHQVKQWEALKTWDYVVDASGNEERTVQKILNLPKT